MGIKKNHKTTKLLDGISQEYLGGIIECVNCYNCDEVVKSDDGYCEHCGYRMFGPRRNEIQKNKLIDSPTA